MCERDREKGRERLAFNSSSSLVNTEREESVAKMISEPRAAGPRREVTRTIRR